ncbi:hypothetical protein I552_8978 [Mycobacterium xenopi 3993]|nr:hypothetical protein I552_8978 [Mycobacterium xenopi 3993]
MIVNMRPRHEERHRRPRRSLGGGGVIAGNTSDPRHTRAARVEVPTARYLTRSK